MCTSPRNDHYFLAPAGFRFPLLRFAGSFLQDWGCLPCLLLANAWRDLFDFACEFAQVDPDMAFFQTLFRCLHQAGGGYTFTAQVCRSWINLPSSSKPTWDVFVFAKPLESEWPFDITWRAPSLPFHILRDLGKFEEAYGLFVSLAESYGKGGRVTWGDPCL